MIEKIDIKGYGIFRDFKWSNNLTNFGKTNVIYGWNGCGKSTFTKVLNDIRTKNKDINSGKYTVTIDSSEFKKENIDNLNTNFYIYNETFVKNNIGEFDNIKGIIYLSEENVENKEKLLELQQESIKENDLYEKLLLDYNKNLKSYEKSLSSVAKIIKEESNTYKFDKLYNFNKTSLENYIRNRKITIAYVNLMTLIERQERININKNLINETVKDSISYLFNEINLSIFTKNYNIIQSKTLTSIREKVISVLDNDIFKWIEEGYKLNKELDICPYCNSLISEDRNKELTDLFDDSYYELKQLLENMESYIKTCYIPEISITRDLFYKDFQNEFDDLIKEVNKLRQELNKMFFDIETVIQNKLSNIFKVIQCDVMVSYEKIELYNNAIKSIEDLINKNNFLTVDYENQIRIAKQELEEDIILKNFYTLNNLI